MARNANLNDFEKEAQRRKVVFRITFEMGYYTVRKLIKSTVLLTDDN